MKNNIICRDCVFFENEKCSISKEAQKDCYFKIDKNLFLNRDNKLHYTLTKNLFHVND